MRNNGIKDINSTGFKELLSCLDKAPNYELIMDCKFSIPTSTIERIGALTLTKKKEILDSGKSSHMTKATFLDTGLDDPTRLWDQIQEQLLRVTGEKIE